MCVMGTRMQEVQEASEITPLVSAAGGASGEAQPWGQILLLPLFLSRPERGISAQLSRSGVVRWVFKDVSPQARSEVPFSRFSDPRGTFKELIAVFGCRTRLMSVDEGIPVLARHSLPYAAAPMIFSFIIFLLCMFI